MNIIFSKRKTEKKKIFSLRQAGSFVKVFDKNFFSFYNQFSFKKIFSKTPKGLDLDKIFYVDLRVACLIFIFFFLVFLSTKQLLFFYLREGKKPLSARDRPPSARDRPLSARDRQVKEPSASVGAKAAIFAAEAKERSASRPRVRTRPASGNLQSMIK